MYIVEGINHNTEGGRDQALFFLGNEEELHQLHEGLAPAFRGMIAAIKSERDDPEVAEEALTETQTDIALKMYGVVDLLRDFTTMNRVSGQHRSLFDMILYGKATVGDDYADMAAEWATDSNVSDADFMANFRNMRRWFDGDEIEGRFVPAEGLTLRLDDDSMGKTPLLEIEGPDEIPLLAHQWRAAEDLGATHYAYQVELQPRMPKDHPFYFESYFLRSDREHISQGKLDEDGNYVALVTHLDGDHPAVKPLPPRLNRRQKLVRWFDEFVWS